MVTVKVVMLGDSGVGKSCISLQFANQVCLSNFVCRILPKHFDLFCESTVGASFLTKTVFCGDTPIKFNIWDTAGQEQYKSFTPMYMRGAAAAVIVYDVSRRSSFNSVASWLSELREATKDATGVVVAVVANKIDLPLASHEVSVDEGRRFATEHVRSCAPV